MFDKLFHFPAVNFLQSLVMFVIAGLLFTGCATVPKDYPRTPSAAFEDHASTTVGSYLDKAAASHPGESGFALIMRGRPWRTGPSPA